MSWKKGNKRVFFQSIRARLAFGYILILFVSIIAVTVYFSFQMNARLLEATKQYLSSELKSAIDMIGNEPKGGPAMSDLLSKYTGGIKGSHKIGYALFDAKGHIVGRSRNFSEDKASLEEAMNRPPDDKSVTAGASAYRDADGNTVYMATRSFRNVMGEIFYLEFGVTPFGHQETVRVFFSTGLLMIPLIILLAFISGIIMTSRFLSPITRMITASNELSRSGSGGRLPILGTGDELDKLAASFNNVLDKLRESNQKMIHFTANASHEIRLPITAIKGEAEVALERGGDIEEYREVLANTVIGMDRLTRMITRLLVLSRGDSGLDRYEMKKIELKGLLAKMIDFYRVLAEKKNIVLSLCCPEVDFYVMGDPGRLEELFSNLIENAVRYTPENGTITLEMTLAQSNCAVRVSDTGIGIPEEEQEKIFERFYRVDKARTREDGGAGLGLSIARMIAKAHKGSITVESVPRKGSVFTVTLPTPSHISNIKKS
ncbi:MAG: HAMP domain-containing protein [Candidatus Omnitrophica bacterium]|nr:HAMP domain-containing protein [Candidatus Omnitrophota bacterium]